jgi:polygalacturonase
VNNVTIAGKGKIDGQGESKEFPFGNGANGRPKLVFFVRSDNIVLENIELVNSAFWTCHFLTCDTVKVKGINIYSHCNWNNDGLDIDSKNVEISDCQIDCDDDGICFKSLRKVRCENVIVQNCTIRSNCNAIKFGTGSKSGFRNITVKDCKISKASESNIHNWNTEYSWDSITQDITVISGIAIESADGGVLEDITVSNIEMTDVQTPIFIRSEDRKRAYSDKISTLKNVTISDITAKAESKIASSITGIPEGIVTNILIKDAEITVPGGGTAKEASPYVPEKKEAYPENRMFGVVLPAYGFYIRHAKGITFDNVNINTLKPDARPKYAFVDVEDYEIT